MKTLKDLLRTRKQAAQPTLDDDAAETSQAHLITFFQSGYKNALDAGGNPHAFAVCIEEVYENFKARCRREVVEQEKLKAPTYQKIEREKAELLKRETALQINHTNQKSLEQRTAEIKAQIADLPNDPGAYGVETDRRPRFQFYLGVVLLMPITLYLVVFYISAAFSAFFKDFESAAVKDAILDGMAINKAWEAGWLEAVFVCTIPFAFMGMGYLIHMFQKAEKRSWLKLVALFAVAFVFDAILAYQIELKIYEFSRSLNSPEFNFVIAFTSVRFWGIIFGGFIVYIIWGLVLDFVMKEYESIDKVKAAVRALKLKHRNLYGNLLDYRTKGQEIEQEISAIKGRLAQLQQEVSGFIFPQSQYLQFHAEYTKGWVMAVAKKLAIAHTEKDDLITRCQEASHSHLNKHLVL